MVIRGCGWKLVITFTTNKKIKQKLFFFFLITLVKWEKGKDVNWHFLKEHVEVKWSEVAQSCPILCDPMDCSLPGSIHEIF